MLLGILSDTHDRLKRTEAAVQLLLDSGAETLIHCGDLTEPDIVDACGVVPCHFVLGNNDADNVPALIRAIADVKGGFLGWAGEVILAGKRIAVTHGHLHTDMRRLLAAKPDYLLYGHSHWPDDRWDGGIRWINPGALHRAEKLTVALLDLEQDKLKFLTVPR
jgi:hypothetical protein